MAHKADWNLPEYENTEEWHAEHKRWLRAYNTCAVCGSTKLTLKEHSFLWHDGELWCENNHIVRHWEAG